MTTPIRFGPFEVDSTSGELRKQGVRVKLQGQPLQILVFLLEHPGDVVTREELRQRLWPADTFVDFDHGLYNAIKRLREALGDVADTPRFIETVPRRGYRFVWDKALTAGQLGPLMRLSFISPAERDGIFRDRVVLDLSLPRSGA